MPFAKLKTSNMNVLGQIGNTADNSQEEMELEHSSLATSIVGSLLYWT